jgi:hypothetical protein
VHIINIHQQANHSSLKRRQQFPNHQGLFPLARPTRTPWLDSQKESSDYHFTIHHPITDLRLLPPHIHAGFALRHLGVIHAIFAFSALPLVSRFSNISYLVHISYTLTRQPSLSMTLPTIHHHHSDIINSRISFTNTYSVLPCRRSPFPILLPLPHTHLRNSTLAKIMGNFLLAMRPTLDAGHHERDIQTSYSWYIHVFFSFPFRFPSFLPFLTFYRCSYTILASTSQCAIFDEP